MESLNFSPRTHQDFRNPSLNPSPNSPSSNNNSTISNCSTTAAAAAGTANNHHHASPPATPITRSDPNNPYPTTFVQADTSSFKKVVQMLTGSTETVKQAASARPDPPRNPIPPMKTSANKRPSSKLYERRNSFKNFQISPLVPGFVNVSGFSGSPRKPVTGEILSPSILDFPSLMLSPVTPLIPDPFNRSPVTGGGGSPNLDVEAEEKAIAKKGFYLHPSPATTPRRESEPRLLPLFPVTSPRVSGSSSS